MMMTLSHQIHFPGLRVLSLDVCQLDVEAIRAIANLTGSLSLDNLTLLGMNWAFPPIILHQTSATSLCCECEHLPTILCHDLSPSVQRLQLVQPGKFDNLWPIVDHVLQAHSQTSIRNTCMNGWKSLSTWVDPKPKDEKIAALVQQLTWYAVLLSKEGIHFRDKEGKTVIDYFSR